MRTTFECYDTIFSNIKSTIVRKQQRDMEMNEGNGALLQINPPVCVIRVVSMILKCLSYSIDTADESLASFISICYIIPTDYFNCT